MDSINPLYLPTSTKRRKLLLGKLMVVSKAVTFILTNDFINLCFFLGLLWNKQFYEFDVEEWVKAVPAYFAGSRREHFRENWSFLRYSGIFSVTDKWEYPWVCASVIAIATILEFY